MLNIEIITHGYDKEKEYLKANIDDIVNRIASFDPDYKFFLQVVMSSGKIREYHGRLSVQVFKYLTRKRESLDLN